MQDVVGYEFERIRTYIAMSAKLHHISLAKKLENILVAIKVMPSTVRKYGLRLSSWTIGSLSTFVVNDKKRLSAFSVHSATFTSKRLFHFML